MTIERTLSIIKPDAVENGHIGAILSRFEKAQLTIVAGRLTWLSKQQAEVFYAVHKERPFFASLVSYMTSGPVFISVLEGDNAVLNHRNIMGATDPAKADMGTIRRDFGESIERNASHGSDSIETAAIEVAYFFSGLDTHTYKRLK